MKSRLTFFLFLFLLTSMTLRPGVLHADMVCEGTLNGVAVDNVRPFYIPGWYSQGRVPHYLCALGEEGTPLCKQKLAVMLTAFSLGKRVWIIYPMAGNPPCAGNNSGVIPTHVAIINW